VSLAFAAAAFAVAGCGSSDDDTSTASGGGSTSTAAADAPGGTPIKIGMVAPTGTPAFNENFEIASVKAAVRGFNARGGIDGHPIELVYCNDKGDPNTTASCARQMISEKVSAVVGGALLNGGTVLTPTLQKAGIPQIGLTPISGAEYNAPNVYLFGAGGNLSHSVLAAFGATHKIPTAVVASDNPTAKPLVDALDGVMKAGGTAFTAHALVASNQADYAPLVQAASRNGTKGVLVFLGAEQATQFMSAAESQDSGFDWFTAYLWSKADADKLGGAGIFDRMITAQQFLPLTSENPVVKQYVADMKAEQDSGDGDAQIGAAGGQTSSITGGWLAIYALDKILKQQNVTDISSANVVKALNATKDLDMQGVMPPWTPNAAGPKGMVRAANDKFYLIGWKNEEPYLLLKDPVSVADVFAGKTASINPFPAN
jgi:ABC-type branched-subunit amino acid transport system substrate-binding protein